MRITDFDFELPDELIAQQPAAKRDASRMMVLRRDAQTINDALFFDLPKLLGGGDVLVLNNTKVFPARLHGKSETGAQIEIFLVKEKEENVWETLARPARRLKPEKKIIFSGDLQAEVLEKSDDGRVTVRFEASSDFYEIIDRIGATPLPPYIKRNDETLPAADRERYQTVYAQNRGAIAAPTAGLHFTPEILQEIRARGVEIVEITLHVGYGTFEPVRANDLSVHKVLPEQAEIGEQTAAVLNRAVSENRRIIAVGTTTTRALESAFSKNKRFIAEKFTADLTITPDYNFKVVGAMLTNFHLPQSSLLILISTFGGHDFIMKAYRHAVEKKYRFYSYGDCMLVI